MAPFLIKDIADTFKAEIATDLDKAAAATSFIPIIGQAVSLAAVDAHRDKTGVAINAFLLSATAVSIVFPPVAVALGVGSTLYTAITEFPEVAAEHREDLRKKEAACAHIFIHGLADSQ